MVKTPVDIFYQCVMHLLLFSLSGIKIDPFIPFYSNVIESKFQ